MSAQYPDMLRSLFENSPSAMVIADTDRKVVEVNQSFCRMFRYELDEAQSLEVADLYVESSEFERFRDLVSKGSYELGSKFYASYRRGDGTVFPGQASLMELNAPDGTLIGVAGIINDLSEIAGNDVEILLEIERFSAEKSRQKALYYRSPAMVHSIGSTGYIEAVSEAWLERFGYREDEVIGKRSSDFLTPESREFANAIVLPEFWKTGSCRRIPYTFICKDGSLVEIELSAVLDRTQTDPVTLAVLEDVTERNASRRELEQRNNDLRDFAHIAAHDLQAPIRHISIFSDMMRDDVERGDLASLGENLAVVKDSARLLADLIRSLLDFSMTGGATLKHEAVRTVDLIGKAINILAAEIAETGASIETGTLPDLRCDRVLMLRVFSNLIGNSIKYVEPGVTPLVRIDGYHDGIRTVLKFTDNGIGIPESFRDRVFQPLKRLHGTESNYAGTGIGLTLCKRIVEAHGGSIRIGDAGATGTLVEVQIPA